MPNPLVCFGHLRLFPTAPTVQRVPCVLPPIFGLASDPLPVGTRLALSSYWSGPTPPWWMESFQSQLNVKVGSRTRQHNTGLSISPEDPRFIPWVTQYSYSSLPTPRFCIGSSPPPPSDLEASHPETAIFTFLLAATNLHSINASTPHATQIIKPNAEAPRDLCPHKIPFPLSFGCISLLQN